MKVACKKLYADKLTSTELCYATKNRNYVLALNLPQNMAHSGYEFNQMHTTRLSDPREDFHELLLAKKTSWKKS